MFRFGGWQVEDGTLGKEGMMGERERGGKRAGARGEEERVQRKEFRERGKGALGRASLWLFFLFPVSSSLCALGDFARVYSKSLCSLWPLWLIHFPAFREPTIPPPTSKSKHS